MFYLMLKWMGYLKAFLELLFQGLQIQVDISALITLRLYFEVSSTNIIIEYWFFFKEVQKLDSSLIVHPVLTTYVSFLFTCAKSDSFRVAVSIVLV